MLSSFIITFHSRRLDNLFQTIRFLTLWHKNIIEESEVFLLCQDACGPIKTGFAKTNHHNMNLPEMSQASQINLGIKKSKSDLIVLFESDRILKEGYFETVFNTIRKKQMVTTKKMHRVSKMVADEDIIDNKFPFYEELRSPNNELLKRNMFSGNVTFWKEDFVEAGMADENYIGYGWLDHDLTNSMQQIGVQPIFRDELELHLHHELMTYGSKDQKKLFINNAVRFCKKWKTPYPQEVVEELHKYTKSFI